MTPASLGDEKSKAPVAASGINAIARVKGRMPDDKRGVMGVFFVTAFFVVSDTELRRSQ